MKIRIGTRGSDLALWQANHIASRLTEGGGGAVEVELCIIKTRGDTIDDVPLQNVEGKAFFTAEIEKALLDGEVDLAVHSHKDLATSSPDGLVIMAVPERGPVAEVLLIQEAAYDPGAPLLPLKAGARVGTSAPRRRAQLLALRPDLDVADLRGNVPTRVRRCQSGLYDAVVLAAAGIERLELSTEGLTCVALSLDDFVPAPAQGALAIQIRDGDKALADLCRAHLHHEATAARVEAERSLLERLGGGCSMPLGVHIDLEDGVRARAFLGAGCPTPEAPLRWAEATGETPQAAADAVLELLMSPTPTGFGPLAGTHVVLVGTGLSTDLGAGTSAPKGGGLAHSLEALGARVSHDQVLAHEELPQPQLSERLAALSAGDALAITSQEAARRLAGHTVPAGVGVAAVGPATARALASSGIEVSHVGEGGAAELARDLPLAADARVLFVCAEQPRDELRAGLEQRSIPVELLPVYRTVPADGGAPVGDADMRLYMSPSAVTASHAFGREASRPAALRLGLGTATCEALSAAGLDHHAPPSSGPAAALALAASLLVSRAGGREVSASSSRRTP